MNNNFKIGYIAALGDLILRLDQLERKVHRMHRQVDTLHHRISHVHTKGRSIRAARRTRHTVAG